MAHPPRPLKYRQLLPPMYAPLPAATTCKNRSAAPALSLLRTFILADATSGGTEKAIEAVNLAVADFQRKTLAVASWALKIKRLADSIHELRDPHI